MASRAVSLLGILLFILLAWALSNRRRNFPWVTVLWGMGLQLVFALFILKTSVGLALFNGAQSAVTKLNDFASEGTKLVFGPMAEPAVLAESFGPGKGVILAITVMGTIILVSALSSLFYHWGILQRVVWAMAWVMRRVMRTSGSETLAAAANIFMGQTEAPLLIKPYLAGMTRSEIMAMMTSGMATIAGGVLAIYVSLGASSGHLLTASVLSAPAALLIAKIMVPEMEKSETAYGAPLRVERASTNSIDALCRGASDGLMLSLNVVAMLIAFVALVAMANFLLGKLAAPFGYELTFQEIFGWLNAPFAWFMGVPAHDCLAVGQILGERVVLNEFIGYLDLMDQKDALDPRSVVLTTYALCGFANFGSIAIQIGGIGTLAPERRADLAALGVRSMIGGLLACYLTAAMVGLLL